MDESGARPQIVGGAQCRGQETGAIACTGGPGGPVQSVAVMSKIHQLLLIQPDAAPKPLPGTPCNGCGVCCLLEPCPLGVVLSGRRHGACVAVRWHEDLHQYRCAALTEPAALLHQVLPRPVRRLAPWLASGLARQAQRWIAVGQGCDSSVEATLPDAQRVGTGIAPTMRQSTPTKRS